MAEYRFETLDVFTDRQFGGNPLAVFPQAEGLTAPQMQAIAAEFNLSETTFVLPPDDPAHTARVRIFTPRLELPFAGHPNVGTGFVLARHGHDGTLLFEEAAGLVSVQVIREAGAIASVVIDAPQPLTLGDRPDPAAVAACGGLAATDLVTDAHAPVLASNGSGFVLAEVTPDALSRATADFAAAQALLAAMPALGGRLGVYFYSRDLAAPGRLRARMFAPAMGLVEDPATGSAATPLASLLLSLTGADRASFEIAQGVEMGRPSLLRASAERRAAGIFARVGGGCVPVMQGTIRLLG